MANTLRICSAVREEDHNLVLKFDDPSEYKMLKMPENIKTLTEFSQDFFQKEFKIVMRVRGGDSEDVNDQESNGPQEDRRALANDPAILLADEPTGALDSQTSFEVMKILQEINTEGKTIIVVTHEHDIAQLTHRTIKLKDGVIENEIINKNSKVKYA